MITDAILKAIPPGIQLVDKEEALNNADAADLLEMLKGAPDDEALEALNFLRFSNEPADVGSALRSYDVGLSQVALNRAILPPTQTSLEFELMMRHPLAYPTWAPVQPSKLDLEFLLLPSKIRWDGTGPTLLLGVDISQWTDVPITNEFSIAVLQLYLETDHPLMPLIDVDLLLDGLLGQNEFCSRILVNALFAWACGYAVFEPEATIIGHAFYSEAKELWKKTKEARAADHVCTVAAVQYLSVTAVSSGAGAEYVEFLGDLLEMSRRLGLFNIDPSQTLEDDVDDSADHRRAKSQIAWVLFTCLTRIYDAELLREYCRLFLIIHDMIQVMYGVERTPYAKAITLAFAEETYKRLLMWADSLPLEMAQGDQCTHHAMLLHICYHLAIIDLFRSLLRQNGAPRQQLPAFKSAEATPDAVYAASVNQLKRIVLFYRQNYPESSYCFFWQSALLYLANAMLAAAKISGHVPEWRFYFRLCMTSYQTLYTGFRLAKGITLSLLSMALEKGVMDIPQARAIRKDLELRSKHHELSDLVPVSWVVDLDLAMMDPSAAQAENLVQRFQEVQLYETNGNNDTLAQEP
ncbi:C6 zinc finger domain containing protein [Colletotrichum tofieldiae]|nr:C6 zinc finger domain containing protein [Colletotrichum tofieldiae]